jgi:transcriptional regulator with XRE-family HTH domain
METRPYTPDMGRPISKPRPQQGARIAALRKAAGLSQAELAHTLGVPQSTVAYWETSAKPPRSDVLPQMAKALGVRVEDLIGSARVAPAGRPGPVGRLQRALEQAAALPRRQQMLVVQFVNTLVQQQRRAG